MLNKLKRFFEFGAKVGFWFPGAYDAISGKPSVTLLFVHLTGYLGLLAVSVLLYKDVLSGTIAALSYSALMMIFYMLRKLTGAKFDLDDKSFELSNEEKPESKL